MYSVAIKICFCIIMAQLNNNTVIVKYVYLKIGICLWELPLIIVMYLVKKRSALEYN